MNFKKLIRKIKSMFEPKYDFFGQFREGLAQARNGDKWFHIRQDKSRAYPREFDWVGPFIRVDKTLLAPAQEGDKYFQINEKGMTVLGPYQKTGIFFFTIVHGWIAWAELGGQLLFIQPDGTFVP